MAFPITIPKATLSLEEAVILGWKKQPGDCVEKTDILFEMETDKVVVEVPAPAAGCLLRIDLAEGTAKLDQVIGWIGDPGEIPAVPVEPSHPARPAAVLASPPVPADNQGAGAATPAARRRARELGVQLASVRGTGPHGRITEKDVEATCHTENHHEDH